MTHDTGHPKDRVEEREHGVFVPPDEQHVREDGTPTEPAETAEWVEDSQGKRDPDRVEAIGTEAVPQPATPLDTGTAEDAERAEDRAEEMGAEDDTAREERVGDIAAEDESRPVDPDRTDADSMHASNVDASNVDGNDVDADRNADADRDIDASNVDTGDVYPVDIDARNVDARNVDGSNVDAGGVDGDEVDADEIAVGTASVPEQAAAPPAEGLWGAGVVDDLRSRWDAIQLRFVDDPSAVASDAKALVGEAVTAVREAIDRLEARLDETVADTADETEQLRQRVAHYRNVFESLLRD